MDKEKLERIRSKIARMEDSAERSVEPIIDSLVMKVYLSDYTGRLVIGGLLLVYLAGAHYGLPDWHDLLL